ncbi:hypothetical protein J112_02885 [Mycobacterium tuberculosis str. Beijing/NITR203]|nr:hypothetical protein J112_02885 [Mycobacterium tuberculosis str. Beijing/NITR203]
MRSRQLITTVPTRATHGQCRPATELPHQIQVGALKIAGDQLGQVAGIHRAVGVDDRYDGGGRGEHTGMHRRAVSGPRLDNHLGTVAGGHRRGVIGAVVVHH